MGSYPGLSRCARYDHKGPHREKAQVFEDVALLSLKMEEGATHRNAVLEAVKSKEIRFSHRASRRSRACRH